MYLQSNDLDSRWNGHDYPTINGLKSAFSVYVLISPAQFKARHTGVFS